MVDARLDRCVEVCGMPLISVRLEVRTEGKLCCVDDILEFSRRTAKGHIAFRELWILLEVQWKLLDSLDQVRQAKLLEFVRWLELVEEHASKLLLAPLLN